MATDASLARLGDAIRNYRELVLHATQKQITLAGGPSDVTIRGLERHSATKVAPSSLRKLDRGLGWPAGTAQRILHGGADVVLSNDDGVVRAELIDHTAEADEEPASEPESKADRCLATEPTSELLAELAARYRGQETQIRTLQDELERLRKDA